ncbi:MAG: hypothetical protein HFJ03_00655 [Lachnospira sp.]|jgi:hypothetical protein|nr:hypothetical protein [Lachnospira sp.]
MELRCVKYALISTAKKLLMYAVILSICTVLTIVFRDKLVIGENLIESLPEDFFPLIGMNAVKQMEVCKEVLLIIMGILNLFIIGMISIQSAKVFGHSIDFRQYAFILYQPHGRIYYYIVRMLSSVASGLLLWIGYIIECEIALSVMAKNTHTSYVFGEYFVKVGMLGILLTIFMIGAGILYFTIKNNLFSYGNIVISTIIICFFLGNAYKVPKLVAYYMRMFQMDISVVESIGTILNKFTWLHPLEQLNMFMIESKGASVGILCAYMIIGILFIGLSFFIYMRKDLEG